MGKPHNDRYGCNQHDADDANWRSVWLQQIFAPEFFVERIEHRNQQLRDRFIIAFGQFSDSAISCSLQVSVDKLIRHVTVTPQNLIKYAEKVRICRRFGISGFYSLARPFLGEPIECQTAVMNHSACLWFYEFISRNHKRCLCGNKKWWKSITKWSHILGCFKYKTVIM